MATSYGYYKPEIKQYIYKNFEPQSSILDIGAGCGTYYTLLKDRYDNIDAVEIYEPNITNYHLEEKYHKVYNQDIINFKYERNYDLIIMGDVLEHLSVKDAKRVLKEAEKHGRQIIVAVPYEMPQGAVDGNDAEIHKQPDLTLDIMKQRYPELQLLYHNEWYGYYLYISIPKIPLTKIVRDDVKNLPLLGNRKYTNLFYFDHIAKVGGVTTFALQLASKYKNEDIVFLYKNAEESNLRTLKQYVRCYQYNGEPLECVNMFFNADYSPIDKIKADNYYCIIHADYKTMIEDKQMTGYPSHPKITKYLGVSQLASDNYNIISKNNNVTTCYNPFTPSKDKKAILLISATRLTEEKGFSRMEKLAQALDDNDIMYLWLVFTDSDKKIKSPNVIFRSPTSHIESYIQACDFLVQLSDSESYCYSAVEAWSQGVPVIATDLPVLRELGGNSHNTIFLQKDMSNLAECISKIKNSTFTFKYTPVEDQWNLYLNNVPSTYEEDRKASYVVEATDLFKRLQVLDAERRYIPEPGEQWTVSLERLLALLEKDENGPYVKYIGKIMPKEDTHVK